MPIGIGAGINLGSATAFLYADASNMRRGLLQAERAMASFQSKQEKTREALQKSNAASFTRTFSTAGFAQASGAQFQKLNDDVANAAKRATAQIAKSYADRTRILNDNARASAGLIKQQVAEQKMLADLERERERMLRRRATIERSLSQAGARQVTGIKRDRLVEELRDLKGASGTIKMVESQIMASKALIRSLTSDIGALAKQASREVLSANRAQQLSINQLSSALNKQRDAYRRLAAGAGPEFQKLAEAADRSGRALLVNAQKIAAEQDRLERARKAKTQATTPSSISRSTRAEEEALRRVTAAQRAYDASLLAHERSQQNFTNRWAQYATQRAKASEDAALRAQKALQAEAVAQQQVQDVQLQRGLAALQTAAMGAAVVIGATTKQWVDYEEQLYNVMSISTDASLTFDDMKNAIDDMSTSLGKAPAEIAAGLYSIVQAGRQGDDALEILRVSTEAAVAGLSDVETAARPIIGVLNAYGEEAYTAERASDILFQAVTDGVFSFQDLSTQLGDNLSTGSALGVTLEELAASYVVLTRRSNSLAESTTQVNAVMNSFLKPSEALEAAFQSLTGETATLYFRTHDLGEVLQVVSELFRQNADAAGQLFPNLRAIRGIFGLTAQEAEAFRVELELIENQSMGRREAVLKVQMEALAFQFKQVREEGRQLAITLGSQIAPGLLFFAKALAAAAQPLGAFLEFTHGIVGGAIGIAAGFLVSAAAVARFVSFLQDGVAGLQRFWSFLEKINGAITRNARAMALLRFVMNPYVLALTAAAIGVGFLIKRFIDSRRQAKDTEAAFKSLKESIDELATDRDLTTKQQQQVSALENQIEGVVDTSDKLNDAIDHATESLSAEGEVLYTLATAWDTNGNAIRSVTLGLKELLELSDETLSGEEQERLATAMETILETDDLAFDNFVQKWNDLLNQMRAGDITPQGVLDAMEAMAKNTDKLTNEYLKNKDAVVALGDSLVNVDDFFGTAASRADDARKAMQNLTQEVYTASGVWLDFTDPLTAVNSALGTVGDSAITTIARLGLMGEIDFKPAEQGALDLASKMEQAQLRIDEANESIRASQDAIGEWQGIISLVSDTVGTAANDYAQLDNMVARGLVTQQEAIEIQRAALYLNEQAKLGIEAEQVATAKALPELARFIAAHEDLRQQYAALDPAARGAAEAMKDQQTQALLLLAVMMKLLEVMSPGVWDKSFTTKFIADVSQADPKAAALLDRYGLIPEELRSEVALDVEPALNNLDVIDKAIGEERQRIEGLTQAAAGGQPLANDALAIAQERLDALTKRRHDIEIGVVVDESTFEIPEIISGIADAEELGEEAATDLADAWTTAFDSMTVTTGDLSESLAQAIPELIAASQAVEDFSDPLAFVAESLGAFDNNIESVILHAAELAGTTFNFTDMEREALQVNAALKENERLLGEVDAEIQNNQDDLSIWEGRQQLVDDVLGDSTDTLKEYKRQLTAGEISQDDFNEAVESGDAHRAFENLKKLRDEDRISEEEYNEIKEAGIWLRERSIGGIQDERAEIARSLPDLAAYVKEHDYLHQKYKDLEPAQRGFLTAINEQSTQTAIATALMLSQLEQQGIAAEGATQKFIEMMAASDPMLRAVLEDIGLIKAESPINIDVNTDDMELGPMRDELDRIDERIDALMKKKLTIDIPVNATDEEIEALFADVNADIDRLQQRKIKLQFVSEAGGTLDDLDAVNHLINNIKRTKAGFVIDVDDAEAAEKIRELLDLDIDDKRFKITIDGVEGEESLDRELNRRIQKTLDDMNWEMSIDGVDVGVDMFRKFINGTTDAEARLQSVGDLIRIIAGDAEAITLGVETQGARTAILAITGYIDQTLLTDDFVAYLDADNSGALDAAELAQFAVDGFEGTYKAYLVAEAYEAQQKLEEVKGVKTEILEDGTLKITASSDEKLQEFMDLNGAILEGVVFPVSIDVQTGGDVDATGIPELSKLGEDVAPSGGAQIDIGFNVKDEEAKTELQTFIDTDLTTFVTDMGTKGTEASTAFDTAMNTGMGTAVGNVQGKMSEIIAAMDKSGETWNIGFNTGWNLGDGIRAGIEATVASIAAAAAGAVDAAEAAARSAADSKSPSKLFAKLGIDLMRGLAVGVERTTRQLTSSVYDSMRGALVAVPNQADWNAGMIGGQPQVTAVAPTNGATYYNVHMDVTVPAANFKEWIGTVDFVQQIRTGFGVTLAGSRSR